MAARIFRNAQKSPTYPHPPPRAVLFSGSLDSNGDGTFGLGTGIVDTIDNGELGISLGNEQSDTTQFGVGNSGDATGSQDSGSSSGSYSSGSGYYGGSGSGYYGTGSGYY